MNQFNLKLITIGALITSMTVPVKSLAASEAGVTFGGSVDLAMLYDSHLLVDEIDQNDDLGDNATTYQLKLKTKIKPSGNFSLKGFYQYNGKNYVQADSYDQNLSHFNFDASYALEKTNFGVSHNIIRLSLDQQHFLNIKQNSFYLSQLFAKTYYLKLTNTYQTKTFEQITDRDAKTGGYALDAIIFYDNARRFINLGFSQQDEKTQDPLYAFEQQQLNLKLSQKFKWFAKDNQVQFGWRRMSRDYTNETMQGTTDWPNDVVDSSSNESPVSRADVRHIIELQWSINFNDNFKLTSLIEKTYADSNISAFDYSKNNASLTLSAYF